MQGIAKAFVDLGTKHYPERMQKFWIVGAPAVFSILWNAIIPFVDEVTKSKIVMLPCGPSPLDHIVPMHQASSRDQHLYRCRSLCRCRGETPIVICSTEAPTASTSSQISLYYDV